MGFKLPVGQPAALPVAEQPVFSVVGPTKTKNITVILMFLLVQYRMMLIVF
jgi:hypothetical protein